MHEIVVSDSEEILYVKNFKAKFTASDTEHFEALALAARLQILLGEVLSIYDI